MSFISNFAAFWYDFIVGDDWTVAAGVVVALIVTAIAAHAGIVAWLWLPLTVFVLLGAYAWRIAHSSDLH